MLIRILIVWFTSVGRRPQHHSGSWTFTSTFTLTYPPLRLDHSVFTTGDARLRFITYLPINYVWIRDASSMYIVNKEHRTQYTFGAYIRPHRVGESRWIDKYSKSNPQTARRQCGLRSMMMLMVTAKGVNRRWKEGVGWLGNSWSVDLRLILKSKLDIYALLRAHSKQRVVFSVSTIWWTLRLVESFPSRTKTETTSDKGRTTQIFTLQTLFHPLH